MNAKDKHRQRLLSYLKDWDNPFPNKNDMADVLGIKQRTLYFHFTPDELNEILSDGLDLRKKNAAEPRSRVYTAMIKSAVDGVVPAQKEFLDRTEGKVVERHEHTGKDGKELFPSLLDEDRALLLNIANRETKRLAEKPPDDALDVEA